MPARLLTRCACAQGATRRLLSSAACARWFSQPAQRRSLRTCRCTAATPHGPGRGCHRPPAPVARQLFARRCRGVHSHPSSTFVRARIGILTAEVLVTVPYIPIQLYPCCGEPCEREP
eukprot:6558773-Prymnesium_polylepis.1